MVRKNILHAMVNNKVPFVLQLLKQLIDPLLPVLCTFRKKCVFALVSRDL